MDKFYKQILFEIKSIIIKNTERLSTDGLSLLRDIIEEHDEVPKAKSSCCFKKKIEKKTLPMNYDLCEESLEMKRLLGEFKKYLISQCKDEEKFKEGFEFEVYKIDLEQGLSYKVDRLLNGKKIQNNLNDEVDKYSHLFNVNKIVSKQERKIKSLNKKLSDIEDCITLNECIICMVNERNVIFYPCLHLVCCKFCGFSRIEIDCPSCLAKIENKQAIND